MELSDQFRKNRFTESTLLNESLCLRESASVASWTAVKFDSINHVLIVKKLVARSVLALFLK